MNAEQITLRRPTKADGAAVFDLIAACAPLDPNSMYCNLLQTSDFAGTCVIADREGDAVGWVSGYEPPAENETLFVWQVAVHQSARGLGLGKRMLAHLVDRVGAKTMKTTITKSNEASWAMFRSFADARGAELAHEPWFLEDEHFAGRHATEEMLTISPL